MLGEKKKRRAYVFTSLKWHLNKQEPFSPTIPPSSPFLPLPPCHCNLKLSQTNPSSHTFPNVRFRQAEDGSLQKSGPWKLLSGKHRVVPRSEAGFMGVRHSLLAQSDGVGGRTHWATDVTDSLNSRIYKNCSAFTLEFCFFTSAKEVVFSPRPFACQQDYAKTRE